MTTEAISQRDLRMRSKEIMDAVEHGQSFTVTRDGHEIGELIPMRRRQRFITRAEFASGARTAPLMDIDRFRADLEDGLEPAWDDPYAR